MTQYEEINEQRFREVRDAAWAVAQGGDPDELKEAFGEYFKWHEEMVEAGNLLTFGGQPFSHHNRAVCAGQLARAARLDYEASDQQLRRLSKVLADILDLRKIAAGKFDDFAASTASQQHKGIRI